MSIARLEYPPTGMHVAIVAARALSRLHKRSRAPRSPPAIYTVMSEAGTVG